MNNTETQLADLTFDRLEKLLDADSSVIGLVPVGCVEPHGPHLPLDTDTVLSREVAHRACAPLRERGLEPLVAPAVEYGVTDCASAFAGTVSISAETLSSFLDDLVGGLLDDGFDHVCLINNHLEPGHDRTVRGMVQHFGETELSVATPMKPKWGRTLSDEFKRGECHAGKYETSMMLAIDPERVDREAMEKLEENPVSLSDHLEEGVTDFEEMGLLEAYAGDPASSTAEHGDDLLDRLVDMVVGEILDLD